MTVKLAIFLSDLCFNHPLTMAVIFFIGAMRPVMHLIEGWLEFYAMKFWSPSQYVQLKSTGSFGFWMLEMIVAVIFSISLATIHAALQAWVIGDRDQRIQVPYQASGPLPSEPKAQQLETK